MVERMVDDIPPIPPSPQGQRVWADEWVRPAWIDYDVDGRRVVIDAPQVTAFRIPACKAQGLGPMFRDDDAEVWLDEDGDVRYRRVRDLPDGTTAYLLING